MLQIKDISYLNIDLIENLPMELTIRKNILMSVGSDTFLIHVNINNLIPFFLETSIMNAISVKACPEYLYLLP